MRNTSVWRRVLGVEDDLQRRTNAAILLITHDLGVVAEMADDVAVMYAGRIVEQGPARQIFASPQHPYTEAQAAPPPSPSP